MRALAIRVATRSAASRRRAGRRFGPGAVIVPAAELDGEQLLAILQDRELLVELSEGAHWRPATPADVGAIAGALGEPANEYQGGAGLSVDDEAAAAAVSDAGGEGGGGQASSATADTGATAPASAAGAASEPREDTTAPTSSDSAAGGGSEPEATSRPPVADPARKRLPRKSKTKPST